MIRKGILKFISKMDYLLNIELLITMFVCLVCFSIVYDSSILDLPNLLPFFEFTNYLIIYSLILRLLLIITLIICETKSYKSTYKSAIVFLYVTATFVIVNLIIQGIDIPFFD